MPDSSPQPAKPELEFFTTEELLTELLRRHRTAYFTGIPHTQREGDAQRLTWRAVGHVIELRGLGELSHDYLRQIVRRRSHEVQP